MKCHNEGKTISEIAEIFGVSICTVYNNLQEIADKNKVSRDSLLLRVHKPHEIINGRKFEEQTEINPEVLLADFVEVEKRLGNIIETINNIIIQEEK